MSMISTLSKVPSNFDLSKFCPECIYVCMEQSPVVIRERRPGAYKKMKQTADLMNVQLSSEVVQNGIVRQNGNPLHFDLSRVRWIGIVPCIKDGRANWIPSKDRNSEPIIFQPAFGDCMSFWKIGAQLGGPVTVESCDPVSRIVTSDAPNFYKVTDKCQTFEDSSSQMQVVVTEGHPALSGRMKQRGYTCKYERPIGELSILLEEFDPHSTTYRVDGKEHSLAKEDLQLCVNCIYRCNGM